MNIRNRITLYFSLSTLIISGVAFILIYFSFSENREEEFQLRQKQKVFVTLELLAKIKQTSNELVEEMDMLTIHDLYDEKLLLFNNKKQLIYSSIDDIPIPFSQEILSQLKPNNKWIESKDGKYDIIGTYVESNGKIFYGISKAYDKHGYSKLLFLKYILIATFICISIIVVIMSFFLSKKIILPLAEFTKKISTYNLEENYSPIQIQTSQKKDEIYLLTQQFNKLMKRMNEAFTFQKHAVQHISHELKTPISILVSNFEKIEKETDIEKLKLLIKNQKEDTKSLSEIINALLEIAKAESGRILKQDKIRIDELIFDVADELKNIYPQFQFKINYVTQIENEKNLTLTANIPLIKATLINLMQNCILYANDAKAEIKIETSSHSIQLTFKNKGNLISEKETQFIFQHFFRGENSKGKRGFGLGLVFVNKIVTLHNGSVSYQAQNQTNIFTITLPLS